MTEQNSSVPDFEADAAQAVTLKGTPASRGIAFGRITFLKRQAAHEEKIIVSNPQAEVERFEKARTQAIEQLGQLYEASLEKLGEQNAVVFQIHQMMLDDPDYVAQIEELIVAEKCNAEYAVDQVADRFAQMFANMDNEYMQGRAADVQDVSRRIVQILLGQKGITSPHQIKKYGDEPLILATDDLAPSETVQLDKEHVEGILTSAGSTRSHTVIFARTMGIPAVISMGDTLNESLEGHLVIVDGANGVVYLDPNAELQEHYRQRKRTEDALRARLELFRGKETRTLSGRQIHLYANIGSADDIDLVKASDAEGVGLFRSEYIYLHAQDYPDEESQFQIYRDAAQALDGRKLIIRTMDIGADKTAAYFMLKHEENPAMGMRAVRICLSHPDIFKTQLRALLRASVFGNLAIMFPMITSTDEVKACRKILQEAQAELTQAGIPFNAAMEVGIMIETPAAALISDELAPLVDFFSIGTNDLTQFTLAVDRQNAEVGRFLNPYHHAVIRLIEMTIKNAHAHGIWAGVCGELAADEGFTHQLIAMGVDEISVTPSSVLMLRARIATLA